MTPDECMDVLSPLLDAKVAAVMEREKRIEHLQRTVAALAQEKQEQARLLLQEIKVLHVALGIDGI